MNIADDLVNAFNDGYKQGKRDVVVRGSGFTATQTAQEHNFVTVPLPLAMRTR